MIFKVSFLFAALSFFFAISTHGFSYASEDIKSMAEITALLQKWPRDFNDKNIQAVCDLFAADVIASYPGTKDRNYEEMCRQFRRALADDESSYHYEPPNIEQILVDGEIAVVRLIWTLKISNKNQPHTKVVNEKGLDVFERQKDGSWKIVISYAYPLEG